MNNREIAEDITQETFLRFMQGRYVEQGKEMNYLYSIARNLCIDAFKEHHPEQMPDTDFQEDADFEDRMVKRMDFMRAFETLPVEEQEILLLRYVNDEPIGLISRVTGQSRFAIYRKIVRIKNILRDQLEKEGF